MGENDRKILKTELLDKWKYLTKKLAYPYKNFNSLADYQKPVYALKKEAFFSKSKNDYPIDEEIERTKEIIKFFKIKKGKDLTRLCLESDVPLLTCVFEKIKKVSINKFGMARWFEVYRNKLTNA